ncbi:hypothetical protein NP493_102g01028 [Ridgeia piscesae]|uniref:Uncharacterized protein n=1 Tax=Ridgeia piscesae TaxID=27915 RepID=A0AAD9P7G5_RIDPI|nr:hypothetical protein NP493_102g01028 [Ridgeia piscesae]
MVMQKAIVGIRQLLIRHTPHRPPASLVLTCHLRQLQLPHWTSYCVRYSSVQNDQFGLSHFNWTVDGVNYHILRIGCFPFIKYHCTKRPFEDLTSENNLYTTLKLINLGVPSLLYGLALSMLVKFHEDVVTPAGTVRVHFLNEEDRDSPY